MNVKTILAENNIKPDAAKDQFFLEDEDTLRKMVDLAEIDKKDTMFEIGAGIGNLTKLLAEKAGRVIAYEVDERFAPLLSGLPGNVEVHFENAWGYAQLHGKYYHKKEYNKVVSNLPYSFVEQFLHNLTFLEYDKVILLVPLKIVEKIKNSGVFSSFFIPEIKFIVEKEKFFPVPKTNSAVIEIVKLPKPLETKNLGIFLRQYMYQHEGQKVKNSLMEGIIKFMRVVNKKELTKNEARKIISESGINTEFLEQTPGTDDLYCEVGDKFNKIIPK